MHRTLILSKSEYTTNIDDLSGCDLQANYSRTLYIADQQLNDAKTLSALPSKKK
jgi:hypothetical protein